MSDQKPLGADAAAVARAGSIDAPERQAADAHKNCKAELDRMRLLLQRASGGKKAYRVEMEPAAKGFAIVVTGVTAEDEWRFAHEVSQYLKVMFDGALRFMSACAAMDADEKSVEGAAKLRAEFDIQMPETGNPASTDALGSVPSAAQK